MSDEMPTAPAVPSEQASAVSPIVVSLAALFQADEPMLYTQIGALCRWLQERGAADARAMCRRVGLDEPHTDRLCALAGVIPQTEMLAIRGLAERFIADVQIRFDLVVLTDQERDVLLAWVHQRMGAYREGADYEPSLDDYAEWIGLDLEGQFEVQRDLARALCDAAVKRFGWGGQFGDNP